MKKIYLLVHWDAQKNKHNPLRDGFIKEGYKPVEIDNPYFKVKDYINKHRIIIRWIKYFYLGMRAIRKTNQGDTIICSSFTAGISLAFFNKLFRLKRKIILMNLIARKKEGLNAFLRKKVYHYLLNQKELIVTLNSMNFIESLQKEFNIGTGVFHYLPDSTSYQVVKERPFYPGDGYVFAGGDSSRDWNTFLEAARSLPSIKFVIVASRKNFKLYNQVPENVELKLDVNEAEFYDLAYKSSFIVLPISEDVPAGLIVIVNASFLNKAVVATQTSSIGNYIIHEKTGLLYRMKDAYELAEKIRILATDESLKKRLAANLKDHIENNYTDSDTVKKLIGMCKALNSDF